MWRPALRLIFFNGLSEKQMWKRALVSAAVIGMPSAATVAYAARPGSSPAIEPHLVALPEIEVPVIDSGRVQGRLHFEVVLDAADEAGAVRLSANVPRLRAATIASAIEFSRLYVSGAMPVDAAGLASALTKSLQAADPDVGRVLIVKTSADFG
jgi:hypothetical protein